MYVQWHLSAQQPQPQTPSVTTRTRFACTCQLTTPQTNTRGPHMCALLMLLVMLLAAAALSCCPGCPAAASTGTGRGSQCPTAAVPPAQQQDTRHTRSALAQGTIPSGQIPPLAQNSTTKCKADPSARASKLRADYKCIPAGVLFWAVLCRAVRIRSLTR